MIDLSRERVIMDFHEALKVCVGVLVGGVVSLLFGVGLLRLEQSIAGWIFVRLGLISLAAGGSFLLALLMLRRLVQQV